MAVTTVHYFPASARPLPSGALRIYPSLFLPPAPSDVEQSEHYRYCCQRDCKVPRHLPLAAHQRPLPPRDVHEQGEVRYVRDHAEQEVAGEDVAEREKRDLTG